MNLKNIFVPKPSQNPIHKLIEKKDVLGVVKYLETNPKFFFDQLNVLLISRTITLGDIKAFNLYWTQNYSFHDKCLKFVKPFSYYCSYGVYKTDSFNFENIIGISNLHVHTKAITYDTIRENLNKIKVTPVNKIDVLIVMYSLLNQLDLEFEDSVSYCKKTFPDSLHSYEKMHLALGDKISQEEENLVVETMCYVKHNYRKVRTSEYYLEQLLIFNTLLPKYLYLQLTEDEMEKFRSAVLGLKFNFERVWANVVQLDSILDFLEVKLSTSKRIKGKIFTQQKLDELYNFAPKFYNKSFKEIVEKYIKATNKR